MKTINNIEQFKALELGTKVYKPTATKPMHWYYYGINPRSDKSVMLGNSGNVNTIEGVYIGDAHEELSEPYYLDYKDACLETLEKAKQNVEKVRRIFVDNK